MATVGGASVLPISLLLAGVVLLVIWPLYHLGLAAVTAWDARRVRRLPRGTVPPSGHEPLTFWIIVPCLNEERAVGNTVRAALALAGPDGTRTGVVAVDDGSDDGTPAILAAIDDPCLHVLTRVPPDARRGKGEALNAAYRWIVARTRAAGEDPARVAVGVIDGDGRGSPNLLREVSRAMRDPRVGATQCRVRIHNRSRVLAAVLGGNGQFTRLSALSRLGDALPRPRVAVLVPEGVGGCSAQPPCRPGSPPARRVSACAPPGSAAVLRAHAVGLGLTAPTTLDRSHGLRPHASLPVAYQGAHRWHRQEQGAPRHAAVSRTAGP